MQFENELMQQIKATAALLKLDEYVIEKDYFLTKAIGSIIDIQNPNYRLVFQGGTCLAKAHNIIDRMSEDSDFRIQLINDKFASKEQEYKLLKEFRKSIITKLKNNNFVIHDEDIQVFNEGKSMSIRVAYPSTFAQIKHIKPYLAMDFFLGNVRIHVERKNITTMIQMALQDKVQHSFIEVDCISILETAAEKWVALTRRIANIAHKKNLYDSSLIRHLYDIYSIYKKGHINNDFIPLVNEIVKDDQEKFKNVNTTYYTDPISEIKRAINELETNNIWQKNWDEFTNAMVFGKDVPSYQTVITVFSKLSQEIIQAN